MRRHYDAPAREKQAPPLKSSRKLLWRSRSYGLLELHNCKRIRTSVQPVRVSVLNGGFNRFSRFACDDLVFKDLTIGRQLHTIDLVIVFPQPGTDQGLTAMEERLPNCHNQYCPWPLAIPLPALQQFSARADFGRPVDAQRLLDAGNQKKQPNPRVEENV